ncbi:MULTISPECIES: BREX-1 system adenine-specific DNA-methyltransferase PglX [Pontibacillus]|uniref:site-specific DNA-methyltransferase (adenine-specific) n=1 Tax=Pontibacillus chungwhensis TaxID=265426 RepID=A0ABY8V0F7_9BACI|nr:MULTISPECIES: BREX-1 system adenine-specific DNA-methyltransferase PglX [Pontibacillus]MCD5325374.1 BREX-1 system adenine-specific DNA-methyltransferase PglX [Pontibacillus sp. HN14]WIF98491.1 BREX-1 system adenine-specific DNA-methyltransferase PglX [Pontibacillus chungwhensis]
MNKVELKKFAVEARRDLINKVSLKAGQYGIQEDIQELKLEENYGQIFVNGKPYPSEMKHAFHLLQQRLSAVGYNQLIEEVAYTWFNRIIAIRYMEVNNYLPDRVNVLSSSTGKNEPDILHQYETMNLNVDHQKINEWIQKGYNNQAFRKLFIAQCNALHLSFPFLFEEINDYTELLLPEFLLDSESIIIELVKNQELAESFKEVEVIGWVYQFYISEPKNKVFSNLNKKKKIGKNEIPAATQLFTPKWIGQYMVENSLGQLWLESNPDSELKENMNYYIEQSTQEKDVQKVLNTIRYSNINIEEITLIDPCCGSGHLLVYAFDLFYKMYEESGYLRTEIPKLILENNLYGIDIDYRAVQLSSFALIMKAREKSRRIFKQNPQLNIYEILETNSLDINEIIHFLGCNNQEERDLRHIYNSFYDAKNYGSLIVPTNLDYKHYLYLINKAYESEVTLENYILFEQLREFEDILTLCSVVGNKYDVSITNPPYMGSRKAMNKNLKEFVNKYYPESKSDLYACFIERCNTFTKLNGMSSLVTQHSFMFTDDYKKLRKKLLENTHFLSLVHLGTGSFPEINGEIVQTTMFVLRKTYIKRYRGEFVRLVDYKGDLKQLNLHNDNNHYNRYVNEDFKKVKGFPLSYWMSENMKKTFLEYGSFEDIGNPRAGITTGDNEKFVRFWAEVNYEEIGFQKENISEFHSTESKYVPYNKGGKQRKWYGNNEFVLKFDKKHYKLLENQGNHLPSRQYYFRKSITWSDISGRKFAARYCDYGFVFDVKGSSGFPAYEDIYYVLALLNSSLTPRYIDTLNPTLSTQVGDLKRIPIVEVNEDVKQKINELSRENVNIAKDDWDRSELSWDFVRNPLINYFDESCAIDKAFNDWKAKTYKNLYKLKENEEKLNHIFINLYQLQGEMQPEVETKDLPFSVAEREAEAKSFLSYFIGCVVGRYSLDYEGVSFAGGKFDVSKYKKFQPTTYGLIQFTDEHYFDNDIIVRLREFLSVAFSTDNVVENMRWLAESLKIKNNESPEERLRRYFLDEFFKDHCKMYQKRPIYWLVDSGKQKGLRTLIYMHRYQPDTMATIRFEHLQEIQSKYQNEIDMIDTRLANPSLTTTDRRNLEKSKTSFQKKIEELQEFDKHLATYANEQMDIDLDDGVKVNYAKFDKVLAKIK